MANLTSDQIDAFLAKTRQGVLLSVNADGSANGAPVWFDWDGEFVRFFSGATAPKVERMRHDPRISMLVSNDVDETPMWVRFDGEAEFAAEEDPIPLAVDVLAPRYWDLTVPGYADVVDQWRAAPAGSMVVIRMRPTRISSSDGS